MYPNVCVIALVFLSLENVSCCRTWISRPEESPTPENFVNNGGTKKLTCVQRYKDGKHNQKVIVEHIIPTQIKVTAAYFTIKVEIFDNNTEIYCSVDGKEDDFIEYAVSAEIGAIKSVFNLSTGSIFYNKTTIKVTNETSIANEELAILKFNETQNVSFICPELISKTNYTQLGIINPSSKMIETVPEKSLNQEFNKTHNRTTLCCIHYVVNGTEEWWITRYVSNKTLLVYDDGNYNEDNDNRGQDYLKGGGNRTKIYVIATAAVAAGFMLLFVTVLWKKSCRKIPKSDAKVLYADLDIVRQTAPETSQRPRPQPEEESPYAQIMGVMRPS